MSENMRRLSENTRYYFAYGSKTNTENLRDLEVFKDAFRKIGKAYLPDQELVFSRESKNWKGGALGLRPRRGQLVEGVMFEVTPEGWTALDEAEGVHVGAYEPVQCVALTPDGAEHPVTTYNVCKDKQKSFIPPSPEYLKIVRDGYAEHDINDAMLMAVSRNETPALDIAGLFVYGTLMRGECRFHALKEAGLECVLLADTHGRLFDCGAYPAMTVATDDQTIVQGEFVRLRDPGKTLETLDEIEGFKGHASADSLYRRTLIDVHVGDGRIRRAWTYLMPSESVGDRWIESGDWRAYHGRREGFIKPLAAEYERTTPGLVSQLANLPPFSFDPDRESAAKSLTPLWESLERGAVSERKLAQESNRWVVVP